MTAKDIAMAITSVIIGALSVIGIWSQTGTETTPTEDPTPKMSIHLSPGIPAGVTDGEARECFDGGGNYRFGDSCVPHNVK